MINTRESIPELLNTNSVGCEVGIFEGDFSQVLVDSGKFKKLYLVDIFSGVASNFNKTYNDASCLEQKNKDRFLSKNFVEIIKRDSISYFRSIPDNFFDFIYIDTIHSYEQTTLELYECHRTIKNNGFICGHDYCLQFNGVIKAVKEFCLKYNYEPIITTEKDYPSFIIKIKSI
jgi:hypothetical protein